MSEWPCYLFMDLGLLAIAFGVIAWAWPRLNRYWLTSTLITVGLVMVLQVINEVLSLNIFKAWSFSEKYNHLVGINWLGAPLEEYLYWFAFAWILPFLYAGLAGQKNNNGDA